MQLKERVKATGLKISKLAYMLDISQPELSMYLNGTRDIPENIEKRLEEIVSHIEKLTEK